jgi:hypothetical protein
MTGRSAMGRRGSKTHAARAAQHRSAIAGSHDELQASAASGIPETLRSGGGNASLSAELVW